MQGGASQQSPPPEYISQYHALRKREVLAMASPKGVLESKGGASHQFPPIQYNPQGHGGHNLKQTPRT